MDTVGCARTSASGIRCVRRICRPFPHALRVGRWRSAVRRSLLSADGRLSTRNTRLFAATCSLHSPYAASSCCMKKFRVFLNWRNFRKGRTSLRVRGREYRERSQPAGYRRLAARWEFDPNCAGCEVAGHNCSPESQGAPESVPSDEGKIAGQITCSHVFSAVAQVKPKRPTGNRQRVRTLAGGSDADDEGSPHPGLAYRAYHHVARTRR
jgi:hypothetical protein